LSVEITMGEATFILLLFRMYNSLNLLIIHLFHLLDLLT
jgi:hypothetical protein